MAFLNHSFVTVYSSIKLKDEEVEIVWETGSDMSLDFVRQDSSNAEFPRILIRLQRKVSDSKTSGVRLPSFTLVFEVAVPAAKCT